MNTTLKQFYQERVASFTENAKKLQNQLRLSSTIRLLVFLAGIAGTYFLFDYWEYALLLGLLCFGVFLYLVSRHEDIKQQRDFALALKEINQKELRIQDRKFHDLPDGSQFLSDQHEFSNDVDLFGIGSLFQYLNRSITRDGIASLARKLSSNNIHDIAFKQQAVQELAEKVEFRQEFWATAALLNKEQDPKTALNFIGTNKPIVPQYMSWLCWAWLGMCLIFGVLYYLDLASGYFLGGLFIAGLAITGRYLKDINAFASNLSQLERFFNQYSQLILSIEKESFTSPLLQKLNREILTDGTPASARLYQLSRAISRLDQRNNLLFGSLANGLGLWDLKQVHSIQSWLTHNAGYVKAWLNVVAEIDALNSLGNFAYNHSHYIFPELTSGSFELKAIQAHHPLLDPKKSVGNDISISAGEFFIITGANMAGKSTFLRTVSMHIIMSNVGLPVCAEKAVYAPIKLITSMRTSDSLTEEASYFFSELTRLKFIVDKIESEPYFIVLDEILKGTNSQDKANGSRKLIEKLSKQNATGIIATHDLSLTKVAADFKSISNYYFDADITNEELTFDYSFKPGVATNMNASFLLRKMGIVDA